jgi:hypothetical protein
MAHWYRLPVSAALSLALSLVPTLAGAARLISVVPATGGRVLGPTGSGVEAWDVTPGSTYTLTLDQVTDCANGGTAPTINVMVKNSALGNRDIVATRVSNGTYVFTFTMPAQGCETFPIVYCLTRPGSPSSGAGLVGRHDTGAKQSHLRASAWSSADSGPVQIRCTATPVHPMTWGSLRGIYR